jgi:hypothetical protein
MERPAPRASSRLRSLRAAAERPAAARSGANIFFQEPRPVRRVDVRRARTRQYKLPRAGSGEHAVVRIAHTAERLRGESGCTTHGMAAGEIAPSGVRTRNRHVSQPWMSIYVDHQIVAVDEE